MLKTIFFDLDDTLLDFTRSEAFALRQTLLEQRVPAGDEVLVRYHVINQRQWRLLEEGKLTRPQVLTGRFAILFSELGLERDIQAVCERYEGLLAESRYIIPGALEVLKELSSQYNLYLATNGSSKIQRRRISNTGIGLYVRDIFISEEIGFHKPSRAFFEACFSKIPDFHREEALIVGDSLSSDILGGMNAGLRTCWLQPDGETADITPDYRVGALTELPALLKKL